MITERPATSRRAQKAATRQALLDAARAIIVEEGLGAVTCRAVTCRAGVAAGTFFVHFADSASLVEVLLDEHLAATLADLGTSGRGGVGLVDELVEVSMRLFDSYAVEPDLSRAFLTATLFRSDLDGPTSTRLRSFAAWVGGRTAAAVDRSELDTASADHLVGAYFALYVGLLLGGLRGEVTRTGQEETLRWALGRLVTPGGAVR